MPSVSAAAEEPHSDEDLAEILEAQLLTMRRGTPDSGSEGQESVTGVSTANASREVARVVDVASTAVSTPEGAIFSTTVLAPSVAPMPMMFSADEMDRITDCAPKSARTSRRGRDYDESEDSVAINKPTRTDKTQRVEGKVEGLAGIEPDVMAPLSPADRRAFPVLPGFVRRSFDDLISGS
jgi:hypothetical protein